MKKKTTLKNRITVFSAIIITAVMLLAFVFVLYISRGQVEKNIRAGLISGVEQSLQEIDVEREADDDDKQIKAGSRYLEFEDDFSFEKESVSMGVYSVRNNKTVHLAGQDINRAFSIKLPLSDGKVQTQKKGDVTYYVYDAAIFDGCYLRGVASDSSTRLIASTEMKVFACLFPVILIVSVLCVYLMLSKSLSHVEAVADEAGQISSDNDLSRRVDVVPDSRETENLVNAFNHMLDRLEDTFMVQKRFISDASHELRTPMSVILAQCEYLLEDGQSMEEITEGLEVINRQSKNMSGIISDILVLSRIDSNSDKYDKALLDYSSLVKKCCEAFAVLKENDISLDCSIESGITLLGNEGLLTRMINNLVSNAYRYGKPSGHISVVLSKKEYSAVLVVKDDGMGIEEKYFDLIFERFFQIDRYTNASSSGLGLSMVKDIVEFHGGSITVQSEIGKGSEFTVSLPVRQ